MKEKQSAAQPAPESEADDNLSPAEKRRITEQIGRQLRGMYDGLLNQPVPDRFMDLVNQLESGDRGRKRDQ